MQVQRQLMPSTCRTSEAGLGSFRRLVNHRNSHLLDVQHHAPPPPFKAVPIRACHQQNPQSPMDRSRSLSLSRKRDPSVSASYRSPNARGRSITRSRSRTPVRAARSRSITRSRSVSRGRSLSSRRRAAPSRSASPEFQSSKVPEPSVDQSSCQPKRTNNNKQQQNRL